MPKEIFPEFSRLISISNIEVGETNIGIEANFNECKALADRFSIIKLHNLSAILKFSKINENEMLGLKATYSSKITQLCVLTLKPITNLIEGDFSSTFTESGETKNNKHLSFSVNDVDPPELLNNGSFDAGELVAEYLSLEIDPFPRSADADIEDYKSYLSNDKKQKHNPFRILDKLKGDQN